MHFAELIHWLTHPDGLYTLLEQNWLLGLAIVAVILFFETGVVIFPFLPGDSLLFATGAFFGASGHSIVLAISFATAGAFLGDMANYSIGRSRIGQSLLHSRWVKPHHIQLTHEWFARYGGMTIVIGRFIPIVRTFAPFVAGMSEMNKRRFVAFNLLGAVLWSSLILMVGYLLGANTWVKGHFEWVSLIIIVISLIPVIANLPKLWCKRP
ncbi:DedA family protein [Celerinatantimonas yamalensis]|uniref:VTT domain-containing protein n=1 Tax=Celerinatantimonas yamalensis TaxID=559956 RepID=A0ABW9G775_9GAMM